MSGSASSQPMFRGIVPPMATPLSDRDSLDHEGLERLIDHLLAGGVHGVFLLGTTGEAVALSGRLRRELIERSIRQIAGRIPVLVGVPDNSVVESLSLAKFAADVGATAIVLSTPFYLPLDEGELIQYIRTFNRESPLPVMLYNMPRLTSHWFSVAAIREAMDLQNVVGLKDSSDDMSYFADVCGMLPARPDWSLLIGPEERLVAALRLGAHGCVGGGANILPRLLVDLYESAKAGDAARSAELEHRLAQMGEIYEHGVYASGVIRGIKCALELLGICDGRMAEPFARCSAESRSAIERQLRNLELLR